MNAAYSNLFNTQWYLSQNPDVAGAVEAGLITAEHHFRLHGNAEGRSPGPMFDTQHYLAANPDVAAAVAQGLISAYDHFARHGASENRSPLGLFDPDVYLAHNPDVAAAVAAGAFSAAQHFLMYGHAEFRIISPFLNLGAYIGANPDIAAAVAAAAGAAPGGQFSVMSHLLEYGVAEGRDLGNGVSLAIFANDPAFQTALGNGTAHAALDRVAEIAPFLPGFVPPPGWTAPADTPIPLDFIPPEGVRLVVPPSVAIPPDLVLPDTFEPIELPVPPQPTPPAPPQPKPPVPPQPQPSPPEDPLPEPPPPQPPAPAPTFNVEIIGAAGLRKNENGPYSEGDTLVLVFDVPVELGETPFSVSNGASLGTGYTVEALSAASHAQHYMLQLGADASLSDADILKLQADQIRNADGDAAAQGLSITVGNVGENFSLSKGVGFPEAFALLPNFSYKLANEPNFVVIAPPMAPATNSEVTGGEESDVFFTLWNSLQGGPDEETNGVRVKGGGGFDTLIVVQGEGKSSPSSVAAVERIIAVHLPDEGEEDPVDSALAFTGIAGALETWAWISEGTLTLESVPGQLEIGSLPKPMFTCGTSALEVHYANDANLEDIQRLKLANTNIDQLTVAKHGADGAGLVSAGIKTLAIQLLDDNRIGSFTADDDTGYSLPDTVTTIQLAPMQEAFAFMAGDLSPEGFLDQVDISWMNLIPGLRLGELWDNLTIDISALKGWSANFGPEEIFDLFTHANLDLQVAGLGNNEAITIRMAGLNAVSGEKVGLDSGANRGLPTAADGRQSDLVIVLPALVEGGATITIENATLASTSGYTSEPLWNDVIDISGWMGCGCGAELVNHVVSFTIDKGADLGDDWYVDFSMEIDWDGNFGTTDDVFTFTLANIADRTHYNEMLKALDTVEFLKGDGQAWEDKDEYNTSHLVSALGDGGGLVQGGELYKEFKLEKTDSEPVKLTWNDGSGKEALVEEALVGLVGILVNEGTLWEEPLPTLDML